MVTHLSRNKNTTLCGRNVGELRLDRYTLDRDKADCPECLENATPPEVAQDSPEYAAGYVIGKANASATLRSVLEGHHAPDCDCAPCRFILEVMLRHHMELVEGLAADVGLAQAALMLEGAARRRGLFYPVVFWGTR